MSSSSTSRRRRSTRPGAAIVRVLLEELRGRGVSVLLNSHLLSEIELVCDRVAILRAGEVVAAGSPAELSRPRGVELETDEGMRTIEGATREDAARLVAEAVAAGRRVYGVRVLTSTLEDTYLEAVGGRGVVSAVLTIAGYGFREAVRRKVFAVVVLLTAAFLVLFWLANHYVFTRLSTITPPADVHVDTRTFAGAFLLGLAMFATLFLGVVLAVFLTLGVVSGDAERGLLQPLVVRPDRRTTLLLSRFLGAAAVCIVYVLAVYGIALAIIDLTGHWTPPSKVAPGLELAGGVVIVIALSILGSVVLSSTANGIAVFMLFGAGLTAGLLGTIGHALNSHTIQHASKVAAWALPFEALYQDGLRLISSNASGLTGFLLQLGPFGGAYVHGWGIRVWSAGYLCRRARPRGARLLAARSLGSRGEGDRDFAREPRVLRHERPVRRLRAAAALAVEMREDVRRHRLAAHGGRRCSRERLFDERLHVFERLVRRPAEEEPGAAELASAPPRRAPPPPPTRRAPRRAGRPPRRRRAAACRRGTRAPARRATPAPPPSRARRAAT